MQADKHRIVLASNNSGKVREINAMFAGGDIEIVSQSEFNVPEADETGLTFVENAIQKARNACLHTNLPALADDSGIEIDALNGRPGIYSARYAGIDASDEDNLCKLMEEVKSLAEDQRLARFVCVMVFLRHADDPIPLVAEGVWEGIALTEARGENGFGYDPMFYLPAHKCTSAELDPDEKNRISHRGKALQLMLRKLSGVKV